MSGDLLIVNSGSSSIKFAVFGHAADSESSEGMDALSLRYRGHFSGLGGDRPRLLVRDGMGHDLTDETPASEGVFNHAAALQNLLGWLEGQPGSGQILAIGHRVVHGGRDYRQPVRLDAATLERLDALTPLAPLHQPHSVAPMRLFAALRPELPQVACFDTSFHTSQSWAAQAYALPRRLSEAGFIRYGFHGLSYEYVSRRLAQHLDGAPTGRVVMAHLGNGSSLCATRDGVSVASSMGFTTLDGLPMGTRCGYLDPGVVLHLLQQEGLTPEQVARVLYHESGLLGVSGISADMRVLLDSTESSAREAIELFVHRIVREIGALAAVAGGMDHLVFTAGIGERAAPVREAVSAGCGWLGLELDADANAAHATRISTDDSRVSAWVIPTDEELMIACHTLRLCAGG
ncbi:acetate/propionate family kinase [Thiobaca trueperi]|uniref:Acetate kinase n=1 Tax=Thiobaca trueperi TaxID=127458 RepID=A0A4R3MRL2_9GAMM|nr:acetate/propionate family kinase [Thiobaca trueperi]TCT18988.1 acetate kinase [Thiobaca trueperi]